MSIGLGRRLFHSWSVVAVGLMLWGGATGSGLEAQTTAERTTPSGHWSFQPVQRPRLPDIAHGNLVESPVDAFIFEKLEAVGLEPAPKADKRTRIRRATYDLIGLPPSPVEVAEFLADDSPQAFATLVDRLLASPHYGERWGRYWLDVARYANTHGDTGGADPNSPFAFTYRDYVVRALNDDLPYDQFLVEQIAADQLNLAENSPTLAALGFITVGRRFLNNVHDTIDDRIDVVTRGTMGLTVSCARCHDHKFDPIPIRDYYSLYGVFASSNEPRPLPVIGMPDPVPFAEYQLQRQKIETKRDEYVRSQTAEILELHRKSTAEHLLASRKPLESKPAESPRKRSRNNNAQQVGAQRWRTFLEKLNPQSDPIFAPWFAFAALPESEFAERARELSTRIETNSLSHPVNSLVAKAFANQPPASLQEVAERYAFLFAEATKQAPQPPSASSPQPASDPALDAVRQIMLGEDAPGDLPERTIRQLFSPMVQMQIQQLGSEVDRLESQHPGAPLRAMTLRDDERPQNARVFIRGNPNRPGAEVPRQFLQVLAGENREPFKQGSGRLELARAIANRDNALTARVIVNRVWLHHFGEGLVATPDDFGVRCDSPSHPQLLDYLAARFMDEGWSLKKLHRWLMLSHVYQQTSDDGLRSEQVDSENRLLSKMNRRRLDFESLRDTLLFVAGNLDLTLGGRAVFLTPQPSVALGGAFVDTPSEQPPSPRRAIYGLIDRQNLPGLLRIFDFADPDTCTGRRYVTTVPQQALFFFNNPFVMHQACSLVGGADFRQLDSTSKQVQYLYQRVFQRDPKAEEVELASRFIAAESSTVNPVTSFFVRDKQRPMSPWERYAHVLLMSDELIFVD